ncbi:MAG TPA: branched-chain amino acid ABC transporter permease [Pseudonocardiaceae bacterium]|nr:branched-chain amino acid ABC transporter permease [Pseudonocardiaceae bacterium]
MVQFINLTLGGLSAGAVYAAIALALVLIWRATRIVNFAQGGMLMITTFLAFTVVSDGGSYWLALAVAIVAGLVLGAVVERLLIRPVENKPQLNAVVVTFGLLVLLQGIAGMIFGGTPRSYPPAFGIQGFQIGGGRRLLFAPNDLWVFLVVLAVMVVLAVVFRRTSLGLRMRSAAFAPEVARLLGVRVGRMFTVGWALAAAVGALAGVLIAPDTFVSPNAFDSTLVFGFTAAVIGGLDSPPGAVVGGISLGIVLGWVSGYLGSDIVNLGALVVLVLVLMIRPNGLFGHAAGRRV